MKTYLLTALLICLTYFCKAQLGCTRAALISSKGPGYKIGYTKDNSFYLSYDDIVHDGKTNADVTFMHCYYFDSNDKCDLERLIGPVTAINSIVQAFNDMYVPTDNLQWKDYQKNILVTIEKTPDGIITIEFKHF